MTKLLKKAVATPLRKNIAFFCAFVVLCLIGYGAIFAAWFGLFAICAAGAFACLAALVTPSVRYLPQSRHAVISFDISGASKSIRLVRTTGGGFMVCIYTPKTDKTTVQAAVNGRIERHNGTVSDVSDVVTMDRYTNTGAYHKTVLEQFHFDFSTAVCLWLCLVIRSKNDTIFNAVPLAKYIAYLLPKTKFLRLIVKVAIVTANALYYGFLYKNPYPTLSNERTPPQTVPNTAMVSEKGGIYEN